MSETIEQAVSRVMFYADHDDLEQPSRQRESDLATLADAYLSLLSNPLPFLLSLLPEAKWKRAVTDYEDGHKPDQHYSWEASNGGHYSVRFDGEENLWTWSAVYVDYYDETGPFECPSLEAGQAACRADFERRVGEIFRKDGE